MLLLLVVVVVVVLLLLLWQAVFLLQCTWCSYQLLPAIWTCCCWAALEQQFEVA
jgi:hypothetical protein